MSSKPLTWHHLQNGWAQKLHMCAAPGIPQGFYARKMASSWQPWFAVVYLHCIQFCPFTQYNGAYMVVVYGCGKKSRESCTHTTWVPDASEGFHSYCKCVEVGGRCALGFIWIICDFFQSSVFIFPFFSTLLHFFFFFLSLVWVALYVSHVAVTSQAYLSNTDSTF